MDKDRTYIICVIVCILIDLVAERTIISTLVWSMILTVFGKVLKHWLSKNPYITAGAVETAGFLILTFVIFGYAYFLHTSNEMSFVSPLFINFLISLIVSFSGVAIIESIAGSFINMFKK